MVGRQAADTLGLLKNRYEMFPAWEMAQIYSCRQTISHLDFLRTSPAHSLSIFGLYHGLWWQVWGCLCLCGARAGARCSGWEGLACLDSSLFGLHIAATSTSIKPLQTYIIQGFPVLTEHQASSSSEVSKKKMANFMRLSAPWLAVVSSSEWQTMLYWTPFPMYCPPPNNVSFNLS